MHHFDPRRVRKHSSNVSLSSWAALYLIQYRFQECFTVRSRQETRGLRGIHMPHQRTDEVRDRRTVNNVSYLDRVKPSLRHRLHQIVEHTLRPSGFVCVQSRCACRGVDRTRVEVGDQVLDKALTVFHNVNKLSLIHISEPTRLGMISYAV